MAADLDKQPLHHQHTCDRCGARAYVHVVIETGKLTDAGYMADGQLFFCAHHSRVALPVLKERGTILHLIDETRFLSEHVKDNHWVEGQAAKKPGT